MKRKEWNAMVRKEGMLLLVRAHPTQTCADPECQEHAEQWRTLFDDLGKGRHVEGYSEP